MRPLSVSDLVGNLNGAGASLTVQYRPPSDALNGLGIAANAVFGGLMASCLGASYLTAWLTPYAPGQQGLVRVCTARGAGFTSLQPHVFC